MLKIAIWYLSDEKYQSIGPDYQDHDADQIAQEIFELEITPDGVGIKQSKSRDLNMFTQLASADLLWSLSDILKEGCTLNQLLTSIQPDTSIPFVKPDTPVKQSLHSKLSVWFNKLPNGDIGKEHFDELMRIVNEE